MVKADGRERCNARRQPLDAEHSRQRIGVKIPVNRQPCEEVDNGNCGHVHGKSHLQKPYVPQMMGQEIRTDLREKIHNNKRQLGR